MKTKVRDVMTKRVVVVQQAAPFKEILRLLHDHRVSALPVLDEDGRAVGMVSEADLLLKEEFPPSEPAPLLEFHHRRHDRARAAGTVAAEVMSAPVITVGPEASLGEAARIMHEHRIKRLPVVDENGRVLGIVSRRDLLRVFLRPDADIEAEVRDQIIDRVLWMDPSELRVAVTDGKVVLSGQMERRSLADILVEMVSGVEGVIAVESHLSWRMDDRAARPAVVAPWGVLPPALRG